MLTKYVIFLFLEYSDQTWKKTIFLHNKDLSQNTITQKNTSKSPPKRVIY